MHQDKHNKKDQLPEAPSHSHMVGITCQELVRYTYYDTVELPETGVSEMNLFIPQGKGRLYSNWPPNGIEEPNSFYLVGLMINLLLLDGNIFTRLQAKELIEGAFFQFIIGDKIYLEVPVNSVVNALIPADAPKIYKYTFSTPNLGSEDFTQLSISEKIEKPEVLEKTIFNPEPGDYFYGMCVFMRGKLSPLHIHWAQAVRAKLSWEVSPQYDKEDLGRVFVRVSMIGVKARDIV